MCDRDFNVCDVNLVSWHVTFSREKKWTWCCHYGLDLKNDALIDKVITQSVLHFPQQHFVSLAAELVHFLLFKPPLFPFSKQKKWVPWHVILKTPIILRAFIVWAGICPCQALCVCVQSLRLHSLICSSSALNSCGWENKWKPKAPALLRQAKIHKCKITSHLDSWMLNAQSPAYCSYCGHRAASVCLCSLKVAA